MNSGDKHPNPVTVVYVVGSGRCGTTLLDAILGNHPRMYGAGELARLAVGDAYHRVYCPCGRPADECQFWRGVVEDWFASTGMHDLAEHAKLRASFDGPRLSGLSRLIRERLYRSRAFEEYTRQTTELYRSIQRVSGREIVVDSSTVPMRALALSLMPEIDLRLIHIVRDGRGVAWSLKKGFGEDPKAGVGTSITPRSVWHSSLTWIAYNLVSSWVCRQVPVGRAFFCRYEDLSDNTELVLRRIGEFLDCDFEEIIQRTNSGGAIKVGCKFGGNRMRMSGDIRIRLDSDWTKNLSQSEQKTVARMCGWLMRKYGYQV